MRATIPTTLVAMSLVVLPFAVQGQQADPIGSDPDVADVATTPLTDLNLNSDEIPQILIDAEQSPYNLSGLGNCSAIITEVQKFDALLGDDFDLPRDMPGGTSVGAIGQAAVGSFIPFRGLVREVSGASGRDRALAVAVQAGFARRGFLKAVGQRMRCRYPARPASQNDIQRIEAQREAQAEAEKEH